MNNFSFDEQIKIIRTLLDRIALACEGYGRATQYSGARISKKRKKKGAIQQKFYSLVLTDSLDAISTQICKLLSGCHRDSKEQ